MVVRLTEENWAATRKYLRGTGDRFAELLTSPGSETKATATWTVADTAAHVATLARLYHQMVDPAGCDEPLAVTGDLIRSTIVDTVDSANEELLRLFPERDPRALADVLLRDVDRVLTATRDADPAAALPWLGGSRVPVGGLLAHLLNELQIHGRDMARPMRRRWDVPPREAAPFFEMFLVGVTEYGYGGLLDGHGPAPAGRITVEFRSDHTAPVVMAMTDGFVTVEEPGDRPDVRLFFDPTALNLMLFGRISRARAVLSRKVVIRGRRPWVLPAFLRIVRLPS
ncbi:maleylpyruvate isomerase N-terminal domain-containing protein [Actinomadura mexicana]|uniref:Mycothiol maleylpyruvate isomerase N-terminal domain-containing protein n=1 Tax=Actinomadura mexicana TaxID=134959 RepID=A0A239G6H5_9ACTN|nr:maleylpyruvate isomerase N-terminal domain-containing protein [Actinomadura mexicana]SNS64767.1 Mycothiol maleylpyruvate isomerase N-terminal domain-containing protein [Actinomadura mexicana]